MHKKMKNPKSFTVENTGHSKTIAESYDEI
jgi:hypothetical protein